jgi:hypothetical protein
MVEMSQSEPRSMVDLVLRIYFYGAGAVLNMLLGCMAS